MNKQIALKMTTARTSLLIDAPFFGELCLRLQLIEKVDLPPPSTMAVDGKHVYYNPEWVAKLSSEETKGVLAHETMHCVYEHMARRGGRDPRKWNVAGDYVINLVLTDAGFKLPAGGLLNQAFKDMTTDQVYALLPESPAGGAMDQVMDGAPDDVETTATEWRIAVVQAATAAKMAGKLPDSLSRLVDELVTPKVDWRDQLRRFITEKSKDDYSWMRPNRRYLAHNLFLPGLFSENMGHLAVAIDTSGSIDQATLNAFGSEITAAWNSARPTQLTTIYCDARVNHVDTFDLGDQLHFDMHGGGGTDFNPPFNYVEEHAIKPVCFVYLTDGYGPFPSSPPDYPVLWVMTTDVTPPWGEVIRIQL